jgi:hypothetical protein
VICAPGGHGRLARALLLVAATLVAGAMPGWLHGALALEAWSLVNAAAAAAAIALSAWFPMACCDRAAMLTCVCATCAGMGLDFLRVPPAALATLCSSDRWGAAALLAHLRMFPFTSIAMLLIVAQRRRIFAQPGAARALTALPWLALEFGVMLVLMSITMQAFRALAQGSAWNWGAHGMVSAMIVGMLMYFLANWLWRATWNWRKVWVAV